LGIPFSLANWWLSFLTLGLIITRIGWEGIIFPLKGPPWAIPHYFFHLRPLISLGNFSLAQLLGG